MILHAMPSLPMSGFARATAQVFVAAVLVGASWAEPVPGFHSRKPTSEFELRVWLGNMVWDHRFSLDEIEAATGMTKVEIQEALTRFNIHPDNRPAVAKDAPLRIAPWPGGRAVSNWGGEVERTRQRETKVTVFAPWDPTRYVVLDVPEAIWSNLGLAYLAHVDVPTIWTQRGIELKKLEWNRRADGGLELTRKLPNGIEYCAEMRPTRDAVRMQLTLTNGTESTLTDLRIQNCVFLKGLKGSENTSEPRVVSSKPYTAYGTADGRRWVIVAWSPCNHIWNNPKNPCFHSDPKFDDCPPGESRSVHGWLSFFEGEDIHGEFKRIDATDWRPTPREKPAAHQFNSAASSQ